MKLIEQIKRNIKAADFEYGKSIRGKGLEIFNPAQYVLFGHRDYSKENKCFSKKEAIDNANLIFAKIGDNGDKFFIKFDSREERVEIDKRSLTCKLIRHSSFTLYKKAEHIGYIKVSSYDKSYESQSGLIMDLVELDGYEVTREAGILSDGYDTFDGIRKITADDYSNYYSMGCEYELVSGENLVWEDHDESEKIDTRLDYYDDTVVNDFWNFGGFEYMKEYIEEIDPYGDITVYHRKGKDFYVAPSIQVKECYLEFYSEENELEEEYMKVIFQKSDLMEKTEKIVSVITGEKRLLEVESCLKMNSLESESILYAILEKNSIDYRDILDMVDWTSSQRTSALVDDAIEKFLQKNIEEKKLFGKYTHLEKLEKLILADEKKLVFTRVSDFSKDKRYAVSFKNEEYHFLLSELYTTSPQKLYSQISSALTKRLLEKLDQSILFRKAKNVFVGLEDSYESGNCKHGTHSFCSQHDIDTEKVGAIRGDVLLEMDYSSFTKRAVMEAIARNAA